MSDRNWFEILVMRLAGHPQSEDAASYIVQVLKEIVFDETEPDDTRLDAAQHLARVTSHLVFRLAETEPA